MPATKARAIILTKHVETFFRSTLIGNKINHYYIIFHIHCRKTDQLNMLEVAKDFKDANQARLKVFGRFWRKE